MTFRQAINEILIEQKNKRIAEMEFLSFEELGLYFYIKNLSKTELNVEKLARRGNISVKKCKNLLKTLLEAELIQAEIYKKIMEIM